MPDDANLENKLRGLLRDPKWSVPPRPDAQARIRQAARRQRVRKASLTGAAAGTVIVACAAIIPATIGLLGHTRGPAAGHRPPGGSAVYVAYPNPDPHKLGAITPISTATNKPGKPIRLPFNGEIASTLDGKTLYLATGNSVIPIKTATNKPGKPIRLGSSAYAIDMNPDGKTAYVTGFFADVITPINIATNTPGKPIHVSIGVFPAVMAFTPDGKTAYVSTTDGTVTPINTATNTPGKPIHIGTGIFEIAIIPDGKTLYAAGVHTITPISTATNTPGKPIYVRRPPSAMAITPDGKTIYVGSQFAVTPISTATNKVGKPIHIGGGVLETAITPDGKTVYVASDDEGSPGTVTPVSTATNTAGKPIHVGASVEIAITPDGKTLYGAALNKVVPISTATNTPGKPIRHVGPGYPREIVITP